MIHLATWWLWVELLGIVFLPITLVLFKNLPDKGYALSKAVGLLLLSFTVWVLGLLHLLPNTRFSIATVLFLLALVSLLVLWRRRRLLLDFLSANRTVIIVTEVLFLLLLALWALQKAYAPDITLTEKPMEFALFNGILRSDYFPPQDPWLSGFSMNYYYFGYLILAVLTKLSGVPSSFAYNLALPLIFALTGTAAFSLVYNLIRGLGKKGLKMALGFGLVGAFFLLVLANLEGILELLHAHGLGSTGFWDWIGIKGLEAPYQGREWFPTDHWWWWRASRVIDTLVGGQSLDYTITEFPFWSFILGDLHAHVIALPFGLLALSFGLNLLRSSDGLGLGWIKRNPLPFIVLCIALGGLGFLNSWDFPTYTLIFLGAVLVGAYLQKRRRWLHLILDVGLFAIAVMGVAILLYLPFYLSIEGLGYPILPVEEVSTRPLHYFIVWGLFLFVLGSFILLHTFRELLKRIISWREAAWSIIPPLLPLLLWSFIELGLGVLGGEVGEGLRAILRKLWQLLPLLVILSLTLFLIARKSREEGQKGTLFVLVLIFFGFVLTMGIELFRVWDFFGYRMNTVFKLYYQAWTLLAIASAFALYHLASEWRVAGRRAWWVRSGWWSLFALLLAASSVYSVAAVASRGTPYPHVPTLDGLAFSRENDPAEYNAIRWLNEAVRGTPVIVEAVGPSYSQYGRVSARTGLPTVLGWRQHERHWRGWKYTFEDREEDIALIYQSADLSQVASLLQKYDVTYLYVGSLERVRYGSGVKDRFASFMDEVYNRQGVVIYKVRGK